MMGINVPPLHQSETDVSDAAQLQEVPRWIKEAAKDANFEAKLSLGWKKTKQTPTLCIEKRIRAGR